MEAVTEAIAEAVPTVAVEATESPLSYEEKIETLQARFVELCGVPMNWVDFHRELLGVNGTAMQLFRTREEQDLFRLDSLCVAIQETVKALREKSGDTAENEPTRVITVRLPKTLHEALKAEAHLHQTSMNQLCITKLLQLVRPDYVPNG
jgi:uncharacterized protein (DUF4415 family)